MGASLLALCSETKSEHTARSDRRQTVTHIATPFLSAWVVPKLDPGNTYRAPNSTEANKCQCSSVSWSLLVSRVLNAIGDMETGTAVSVALGASARSAHSIPYSRLCRLRSSANFRCSMLAAILCSC